MENATKTTPRFGMIVPKTWNKKEAPSKVNPKNKSMLQKYKNCIIYIYIYISLYIHLIIYLIIIVTKKDFPSCPIALSEQLKFLVATASWPFSAPHSPDIDRSMCEITVTRLPGPENK